MEYEGVLSVKKVNLKEKGIYAEFSITKKGIDEIEEKLNELEFFRAYEIIEDVKTEYNEMNIVELVELTHKLYPEYIGDT